MLDHYKKAFAKLRADAIPGRWTEATNKRAPYKPFLLLAILDLVAQHEIQTNFIELNAELLDVFDLYWTKVIGQDKASNIVLPFFHLKSEGFWHLIPQPSKEEVLQAARQIRSFRDLSLLVLGAKFDDTLFSLMQMSDERDELRRVLIEHYFAPEIRPILVEAGAITKEAFEYSRELLDRSRGIFKIEEAPAMDESYLTESRSVAFRRVVVQSYNHTCAVCGIRLLTPEGRTAVAASHIVPWSHSHNDDPRNGLALCGLHHWAFDQGLITVTPAHEVAVSSTVPDDAATAPIRALAGRSIQKPSEKYVWPAREALRWHNKNIFRADILRRLF
ncbi:MAG TPA: HNH endonuclease [Roseiflexaceae bacterium]|nr:HNH endonuclease [Roseiflexaceae bacterium]